MTATRLALFSVSTTIFAGCAPDTARLADAHAARTATACESDAVLAYVNTPTTDAAALKAIGVYSTGANNLVAQRNGADSLAGTADDVLFTTLDQVDAVSGIGDSSMDALLNYVAPSCAAEEPVAEVVPCGDQALFDWLNDPQTTADDLTAEGIYSRAASSIVAYRDTQTIDDWTELDAISQVGTTTMEDLHALADTWCVANVDVLFSPQAYDQSHLAEVVRQIDSAEHSIEIAMYSFSDSAISSALENAVDRGVSVRMVFETAATDRSATGATKSSRLEDIGVEVRWVNKTMHHKFAIFDGPRTEAEAAKTGTLMSGSGNWSYSGATKYDENTIIAQGDEKLMLQYQQEFNLLWDYSREFIGNESIVHVPNGLTITDEMIAAADGSSAHFTSDNFKTYISTTYGGTFSKVRGRYTVTDALVDLIANADSSIRIASGHLRNRQIADALIAKRAASPEVDIRVYLDGQEYLSEGTDYYQEVELEECLTAAGTSETKIQDCYDYGYMYAWDVHDAGVPLKFDYYAYRWDYSYAEQMHHKYMIVDGDTVATGSYNLSINSELESLENVMVLTADRYPDVVAAYVTNFESLWVTGEAEGLYDAMIAELEGHLAAIEAANTAGTPAPTGEIDIVFPPMALTQPEVYALKNLILDVCPDVNSDEYQDAPSSHLKCTF